MVPASSSLHDTPAPHRRAMVSTPERWELSRLLQGEILLPRRRDRRRRELDEDVRGRRARLDARVHVDLVGQAVALAAGFGGARGPQGFPPPTPPPWAPGH